MKKLFVILALWFLPLAASATDNPFQRFFYLCSTQGLTVDGAIFPTQGQPPTVITPNPSMSSDQQTQINSIASTFDWTLHPDPDMTTFTTTLTLDPTIGAQAKLGLQQVFPLLALYSNSYPSWYQYGGVTQQAWSNLKTVYGSTWLTPTLITEIETLSANCNFPLNNAAPGSSTNIPLHPYNATTGQFQ